MGTGEGHTTSEVLKTVAEAALKTPEVVHAPPRPGDLERSVLSPLKLMAHGWRPEVGFGRGSASPWSISGGIDLPHPGIPKWAP